MLAKSSFASRKGLFQSAALYCSAAVIFGKLLGNY